MKAILYDVHSYERAAFDRANDVKMHQLIYVSAPLDPTTARLAEGHPAVVPSLSDVVDEPILDALANLGVRLIALRSAGYNNLDVTAAARLGIKAVYVPAYTPHSVAEHVFALTLALLRHVPRAVARTRDANFEVEGLVGTLLEVARSASLVSARSAAWSPESRRGSAAA
jgi:D-lactate dehydrogenase